jgi:hypothetical protein
MAQANLSALNLTTVNTVAAGDMQQIGQTGKDVAGNEYIYLPGAANVVANDFCTFTQTVAGVYTLARGSSSAALGRVVVAQAAVNATTSGGWFLYNGTGTVKSTGATAGGKVFATATAGTVSSTAANDTLITGAVSISATDTPSTGLSYVMLDNAFWHNELGTA